MKIKSPPLFGKKILIDPGHGGTYSGAVGVLNGEQILEKDLALIFSLALRDYMAQHTGATVIMTRTEDISMTIGERSLIGKTNNVDAVVSVHFNSSSNNMVKGIETFYALPRHDAPYADKLFTDKVHASMRDSLTIGTGVVRHDRGVRNDTQSQYDGLGILRDPAGTAYLYPRCLVEIEFISNEGAMGELLPFSESAQHFALGVTRGICEFFEE